MSITSRLFVASPYIDFKKSLIVVPTADKRVKIILTRKDL
jgi:hypothetical protein